MRSLAAVSTCLLLLALVLGTAGCERIEEIRQGRSSPTPTTSEAATPTPSPSLTSTPTPTPATTVPPFTALPCRFHGSVHLDGAPVAEGTVITATIAGYTHTAATPSPYGSSTYYLQIAPPGGVSFAPGTAITFVIGDRAATQTGSWEVGGNVVLNLTAG